jgi:hypothetical protein
MSQLDRLTGIKNLRVRGMSAVSLAAYLKAAGINIIRAAAYRSRETEGKPAPLATFSLLSCAVKERLQRVFRYYQPFEQFLEAHIPFAALCVA